MNDEGDKLVLMCGYLPNSSLPPLLLPRLLFNRCRVVCGGGCGFALAIADSGKLITWGSIDCLGQINVTSGVHGEIAKPFPLPTDASIANAAAGWAHCVAVTDTGQIYTWGLNLETQNKSLLLNERVSPPSRAAGDSPSGDETCKRRRVQIAAEISQSGDGALSAAALLPCIVTLNPSVRIRNVAAGSRHTLALSDVGKVWSWGYGGEGQLGIGSRVSSPHPVPCCIDYRSHGSSYVKEIACGGRHSVAVTDAGALLTFGWGLYGQCGQGGTDDELNPVCVSALLGIKIQGVAAGLWHTVCISEDGDVYAFGGNQFGQLGTGTDKAETLPRLLDDPGLENEHAKVISSGARHSAVLTEDGKTFCWGWNKYGQLGLGDVTDRNVPCEISLDGCIARNVACGWWHTLLLAETAP